MKIDTEIQISEKAGRKIKRQTGKKRSRIKGNYTTLCYDTEYKGIQRCIKLSIK